MTYRILSIDGGGVRGVLVATLLERLDNARPGFLDHIDLFAGTSTGGLLALGLASGLAPDDLRQRYEAQARFVFADSLWDDLKDLGFTRGAQYDVDNLKQVLTDQYDNQTLADLPRKVLISSFDLDNEASELRTWKAKFFHNFPGPDSDGDALIADVAIRTAAAPAYFPTYQGFIDGGVVAGNPCTCALAQALDADTGGQQLQDVALLSLGTGRNPKYLPVNDADWGWSQWALRLGGDGPVRLPLFEIMLDNDAGVANYQCRRLLGARFHRRNPILPEPISLDDVDAIPQLVAIAQGVDLAETLIWLENYFG